MFGDFEEFYDYIILYFYRSDNVKLDTTRIDDYNYVVTLCHNS